MRLRYRLAKKNRFFQREFFFFFTRQQRLRELFGSVVERRIELEKNPRFIHRCVIFRARARAHVCSNRKNRSRPLHCVSNRHPNTTEQLTMDVRCLTLLAATAVVLHMAPAPVQSTIVLTHTNMENATMYAGTRIKKRTGTKQTTTHFSSVLRTGFSFGKQIYTHSRLFFQISFLPNDIANYSF